MVVSSLSLLDVHLLDIIAYTNDKKKKGRKSIDFEVSRLNGKFIATRITVYSKYEFIKKIFGF